QACCCPGPFKQRSQGRFGGIAAFNELLSPAEAETRGENWREGGNIFRGLNPAEEFKGALTCEYDQSVPHFSSINLILLKCRISPSASLPVETGAAEDGSG